MNHRSISAYFSKLGYLKFDFAIFASEVGAFLSWIGVLTEVANLSQSATLTALLWVVTRGQRVILGGVLGRFVDRSQNRLRLMTLSMFGYSLFMIIPASIQAFQQPLPLVAVIAVLPVFRLTSVLARMAYLKNTLTAETLSKQVRLIENIPFIASGVSAMLLILFRGKLSLSQILIADTLLHVLSIVILLIGNSPKEKHIPTKTPLLSFQTEWRDLRETFQHRGIRDWSLLEYYFILAFGSFPVIVNIHTGGFGPDGRIAYSAYSVGLSLGSLVATILSQRSIYILKSGKILPWLILVASLLQPFTIWFGDWASAYILLIYSFWGAAITSIFVMAVGEIRSEIVHLSTHEHIGRTMASVSRGEFLLASSLAFVLGPITHTVGPLISAFSLMTFLAPLYPLLGRLKLGEKSKSPSPAKIHATLH